jgi:hypothetical protein
MLSLLQQWMVLLSGEDHERVLAVAKKIKVMLSWELVVVLRLTPTQHMHMRHANGCMHGDVKWMLQMHVPTSNRVMHFIISNM